MRSVPLPLTAGLGILTLATGLLLLAIAWPQAALAALPAVTVLMLGLLIYQIPMIAVVLLVMMYGLALDVQLDLLAESGGGGQVGTIGAAVVKIVPYALTGVLLLRYGPARAHNWPLYAFSAVAIVSLVVLPMGRVLGTGEMIRSFIGSAAPFVLALAHAPRSLWSSLCKGAILVPLISAVVGLLVSPTGFHDSLDINLRFQGLHSPPYLAGYCVTAIFAATLEYLRTFRMRWLVLGGAAMAVLLASQGRAPIIVVALFLMLVFFLSDKRTLPLRRKVDLVMGGMLPALILLAPVLVLAIGRFVGESGELNFSGRDVIWPYFIEAIERRPLFGYGLGAGKLIVDPEDPQIRLIRSNAAHNEYLRLSVDAGIIGCSLIFVAIFAWVWGGTRGVARADRLVLRSAIFCFLLFSAFDNTLIWSVAVMMFVWFTAALARARAEKRQALPRRRAEA